MRLKKNVVLNLIMLGSILLVVNQGFADVPRLTALYPSVYKDRAGKPRVCPEDMFAASIKNSNGNFIRHKNWLVQPIDGELTGANEESFCIKQLSENHFKIRAMLPKDDNGNTISRFLMCNNMDFKVIERDACIFNLENNIH